MHDRLLTVMMELPFLHQIILWCEKSGKFFQRLIVSVKERNLITKIPH